MPRRLAPAASSQSRLALEGLYDPCPSRSALRILVAFAVLVLGAELPRSHKRSTIPTLRRLTAAAESASHLGSFRPLQARFAARRLQIASPFAPLLPLARPIPFVPAAEWLHLAAARLCSNMAL